MRQIATLPESQAELLADHLLTLKVETRLEPLAQGVALWVCDEDKVGLAQQELAAFSGNPADGRYASARQKAAAIRQQVAILEDDYQDRTEHLRDQMEAPDSASQRPVTVALIAAAVLVFFSAKQGDFRSADYEPGPVYDALTINSPRTAHQGYLADVRAGQVWRLFTPALLHFGSDHLIMNCLAVLYLAGSIEGRRGPARLLVLVLVLALASNLGQYFLGGFEWDAAGWRLPPSWSFGGLSGVAYGLFGWLWAKSRWEPELGLDMPPATASLMMAWFFLCWTGALGSIANVAHTAGLLAGLGIGWLPSLRDAGPTTEEKEP